MTAVVHARVLELASIAIDFELSADEAVELQGHLDTCVVCRTDAQSLRADAAAIAALPSVNAPDRVRSAVVAGRAPRRLGSMQPLAALLAVALLTLIPLSATIVLNGGFACCGGGAGAPGAPVATPGVEPTQVGAPTQAPTPPATTAPTPSPSPTPSPGTAEPEPSG